MASNRELKTRNSFRTLASQYNTPKHLFPFNATRVLKSPSHHRQPRSQPSMTSNKELVRRNTLECFRTLVSQHDPPSGDNSNGNFREGQASKDKQPQEERQTQASRCLANDTSIPKKRQSPQMERGSNDEGLN